MLIPLLITSLFTIAAAETTKAPTEPTQLPQQPFYPGVNPAFMQMPPPMSQYNGVPEPLYRRDEEPDSTNEELHRRQLDEDDDEHLYRRSFDEEPHLNGNELEDQSLYRRSFDEPQLNDNGLQGQNLYRRDDDDELHEDLHRRSLEPAPQDLNKREEEDDSELSGEGEGLVKRSLKEELESNDKDGDLHKRYIRATVGVGVGVKTSAYYRRPSYSTYSYPSYYSNCNRNSYPYYSSYYPYSYRYRYPTYSYGYGYPSYSCGYRYPYRSTYGYRAAAYRPAYSSAYRSASYSVSRPRVSYSGSRTVYRRR
jgi:hypothetical protein